MEGEINPFQIDGQDGIRFNRQCIDALILTLFFVLKAQNDFAIGFQRHDEIPLKFVFDEHHVVRRNEPDIIEHITKGNLVLFHLPQQLAIVLILGHRRATFFLARLLVRIALGFLHQLVVHWQRDVAKQQGDSLTP